LVINALRDTVRALAGSLLLIVMPGVALAQAFNFLPDRGNAYLTFYLDNDLFGGSDQDYSNGARLSWISGARDPEEFGRLQNALRKLSGDADSLRIFKRLSGFDDPKEVEYNYGFSITQLMFTPEDPQAPEAPPGERPYAGWLGVSLSIHTKDSHAQNSVDLALGTTGKRAYAKQTQDFVHDVRGIDKFEGWDSQIPSEPTLNIYYTQKRRLTFLETEKGDFAIDGFGEWRLAIGNFRTDTDVGALIRFGWNLPVDFSDPRLLVTAYSHQPFKRGRRRESDWSIYGLAGGRAAAVAHDITLDGPVFENFDTGVKREPLVGEIYAGFGIRYRRVVFSYVHTFRSPEFREQNDGQDFGSLALSYRIGSRYQKN
jgi:lipid A 3-O-deacylase